jgi:hypothetical protein
MIKFMAPRHSRGPLKISWNLERQLRDHLALDLQGDPDNSHTHKAKYLLDQLNKAKDRR